MLSLGVTEKKLTGQIFDGKVLTQTFVPHKEQLKSIDLFFSTYRRVNTGICEVSLLDGDSEVFSFSFDFLKLEDNAYFTIPCGLKLEVGKTYSLQVKTKNAKCGNAPTMNYGKREHGGVFTVNGKQIDGELNCCFNFESDKPSAGWKEIVVDPSLKLGVVSVVIPHFNCSDLLNKTLVSLSRQTYNNLEVIVVDDGSTEEERKSVASLEKVFRDFLNLRIVYQENQGAPAARNRGIKETSGEYIYFCDADVSLYPHSLETLLKCFLRDRECAFAYGGFTWGSQRIPPVGFDLDRLKKSNYISTMAMVRRDCNPVWDESLKRHQDWDLWLTLALQGYKGVSTGEYLFTTPVRNGISTEKNMPRVVSECIVKAKHGIGA